MVIYAANTGLFTARMRRSRSSLCVGDLLGTQRKRDGYIVIGIDKITHQAHRLAWFYTHGVWPKQQIDHINGVRNDNRISNLRDVDSSLNMQNQVTGSKSKLVPLLGVTRHAGGKYQASITVLGKAKYLGLHKTPELAQEAYLEAKRVLHAGYVERASL